MTRRWRKHRRWHRLLGGFLVILVTAAGALVYAGLGVPAAGLLAVFAVLAAVFTPTRSRRAARRKRDRDAGLGRPHIPGRLYRRVMAAGRHRCTGCRARHVPLHWDHIFPYAYGGLTWLPNGAPLCGPCNEVKSSWCRVRGRVYYRPFAGAASLAAAERIHRRERRAQLNPLWWLRAILAR